MARAGRKSRPVLSFRDEGVAYSKGSEEKVPLHKMVFLGDSSVGKTCLARLYIDKKVKKDVTHTIGFDHYCRSIELDDGITVQLQIWDTAGMEQYRNALVTKYYRNADAILFVYDITNKQSFVDIDNWISEARKYCGGLENVSTVLVGNKLDQEAERQVTSEEGQKLADGHEMTYIELSAMEDVSYYKLEELFVNLARQVHKTRELEMTRSLSQVVRLSDDWEVITAPEGPIPPQLYRHQDVARRRRNNTCKC